MELSPLLIYESFILAVGIAAIVSFAIFYFRLLRGYNELRIDHDKLVKELDEYGNVITAASKQHIEKLIAHSNELSTELKTELSKLLQSQAQKESGAYEQVVRDVGKELQIESKQQVQDFANSLSREVAESEAEIRKKIGTLYEDARVEAKKLHDDVDTQVASIREQAKAELREHIYQIVEDVVRESTGKLLSKQDQEGIILNDLEKSLRSVGMGGK